MIRFAAIDYPYTTLDKNHTSLTLLLNRWGQGDASVESELLEKIYPLVYQSARKQLLKDQGQHTLQTTELVNEVFIKLCSTKEMDFNSRVQFKAFSAGLIRNILVDHLRKKYRQKRAQDKDRVTLERVAEMIPDPNQEQIDWLALHEQLDKLQKIDQACARVVELRYFGGLSVEETANALNISISTAVRNWRFARSWLHKQLAS